MCLKEKLMHYNCVMRVAQISARRVQKTAASWVTILPFDLANDLSKNWKRVTEISSAATGGINMNGKEGKWNLLKNTNFRARIAIKRLSDVELGIPFCHSIIATSQTLSDLRILVVSRLLHRPYRLLHTADHSVSRTLFPGNTVKFLSTLIVQGAQMEAAQIRREVFVEAMNFSASWAHIGKGCCS